jgi:hypothetical protein
MHTLFGFFCSVMMEPKEEWVAKWPPGALKECVDQMTMIRDAIVDSRSIVITFSHVMQNSMQLDVGNLLRRITEPPETVPISFYPRVAHTAEEKVMAFVIGCLVGANDIMPGMTVLRPPGKKVDDMGKGYPFLFETWHMMHKGGYVDDAMIALSTQTYRDNYKLYDSSTGSMNTKAIHMAIASLLLRANLSHLFDLDGLRSRVWDWNNDVFFSAERIDRDCFKAVENFVADAATWPGTALPLHAQGVETAVHRLLHATQYAVITTQGDDGVAEDINVPFDTYYPATDLDKCVVTFSARSKAKTNAETFKELRCVPITWNGHMLLLHWQPPFGNMRLQVL